MYHFEADQAAAVVLCQEHQVPAHIAQYLKSFQVVALRFLHAHLENREFCILNDESGLGKSASVAVLLGAVARLKKSLIVVQNDEDIVSGWQFHLSVLTKLSVARLTVATAANVLHHNVYIAKWDTLRSLGDLSRLSFDIIVVDNRGQMLSNNFCTSMLLKQYERKVNILVSSVDVTSDLKLLHNVLRLGGGRLESQYESFKSFEEKFKLPNSKDVAGKKADLEEYFLKREKLGDFCRDFRLRRYRHQYEDVLPLVESERYRFNLELWHSNLRTDDSSQQVITANRNGTSDKGTEELFEEELVLNKELTEIMACRSLEQSTNDDIIDICEEPVVMSPLLLESESEEEIELQSSAENEGNESGEDVFEFVELSSESPEIIEPMRSTFATPREVQSSKLATERAKPSTSKAKEKIAQVKAKPNSRLSKDNESAKTKAKSKEMNHRIKADKLTQQERARKTRSTNKAEDSKTPPKKLRSNAEKEPQRVLTTRGDKATKRKSNAAITETQEPKRLRSESRNALDKTRGKDTINQQNRKGVTHKRQESRVSDSAMTKRAASQSDKKRTTKTGTAEKQKQKEELPLPQQRVTRTNRLKVAQPKINSLNERDKQAQESLQKKKGKVNKLEETKGSKKLATTKDKQKDSCSQSKSTENKANNNKMVANGGLQVDAEKRMNASATHDKTRAPQPTWFAANLVIKQEIVDEADDLKNSSVKAQIKRSQRASVLPTGVHSRETRGMQRLTRSAPSKNKYIRTNLALIMDKKSDCSSPLSRSCNHRQKGNKQQSKATKENQQTPRTTDRSTNAKKDNKALKVRQGKHEEKDCKPMPSQILILTGSSVYDDIQCGQKLVTDSGSSDSSTRRGAAPLQRSEFLVPAAPGTSRSTHFPLLSSSAFFHETPDVSFVPDAKTQDIFVLTSSQDDCSLSSQSSQSRRTRALKRKRPVVAAVVAPLSRATPSFSELLAKQTERRSSAKSPELFSNCSDAALACTQPNTADSTKSNGKEGAFEGFKIFGSEVKQFQQQHALNATKRGVAKSSRERSCLDILEKMFEPRKQQKSSATSATQPQRTATRRLSKTKAPILPALPKDVTQVADAQRENTRVRARSNVDEDIFEITNNETFGSVMRLTANGDISPVQQPLRGTQHNKITNYLIASTQPPDEEQPDGCRTPSRRTQLSSGTAVRKSPKSKTTQATKLTKWFQKHANGSSGSASPEASAKQQNNAARRRVGRPPTVKCRRLDLTSQRK